MEVELLPFPEDEREPGFLSKYTTITEHLHQSEFSGFLATTEDPKARGPP